MLHNGNEFPSIPVGHYVHMKEEYENVKTLFMIKYTSHNWELCGDFKMLAFLLGQQRGYKNIPAFSAFGIAELMNSITQESCGPSEKN